MTGTSEYYIGTSSWSIPREYQQLFRNEGSHLERYCSLFNAVEINSAFYQDHQFDTYQRWRETVPEDFGFSVKLFKRFTHEQKLKCKRPELEFTLSQIYGLEEKWKVLLVQLPPKLELDLKVAENFFMDLRSLFHGHIVLEARNCTWAQSSALPLYHELGVSLCYADPERCEAPAAVRTAGEVVYYRYHGSPIIYRSSYSEGIIAGLARSLKSHIKSGTPSWCIFDNTTFGEGSINGRDLQVLMRT